MALTTNSPLLLVLLQWPNDRILLDLRTRWLLGVVLVVLAVLYVVGRILRAQPEGVVNPAYVEMFNQRVRVWWMMSAILVAGIQMGYTASLFLFFLVSFWALREFITMTPTRRGDHRALFWVFFICTPAQYVLVGLGNDYYPLYSILIPVYASLFIPARIAVSGDPKRFLERSAKIQFGLLICVYSLSYTPALLHLELQTLEPGSTWLHPTWTTWQGSNAGLLFYFVLIVQLSEIMQWTWGKLIGQHVIAPSINASRTWEGLLGGVASTSLLGILFKWFTPFGIWEAACMSMVIAGMGFAGQMTMSAIKRDRGVTDTGTLVQGRRGVLDRLDSLCFAAPVFYHLTKFFYE